MTPGRSSRPWERARKQVLSISDVCHLCGQPGATTVDHIVPVSRGGSMFDPRNLAPAHSSCNYSKGKRLGVGPLETSRAW